jgi:outer membrane receptor protein involved in Fe transport
VAAAFAIGIVTSAASAQQSVQEGGEDAAPDLGSVVVTGEKRGRSLDETSSSARVISGAELEEFGDRSLDDALARTGGAVATEGGQFSLRGISSAGVSAFDLEDEFARPLATVRVDGIVLDRIGSQFGLTDLFDIAQVEVLRGPQSTTQGRSALAGSIVVNTREPTPFWDFRALARGFTHENDDGNSYQLGVAGGGPLTDSTAFRVTAERRADSGDITNITRNDPDWDASESNLLRFRLKQALSEDPNGPIALASVVVNEGREGPRLNFEPAGAPGDSRRRTAEANADSFNDVRFVLGSLELDWPLAPGWSLTAITGTLHSTRDAQRDFDFTAESGGRFLFAGDASNLTQELQLRFGGQSLWGMPVSGLVGLFGGVFDDEQNSARRGERVPVGQELPPPFDSLPVTGDAFVELDSNARTERNAENIAVFGEVDLDFAPAWTLTLGLRYDRESAEAAFPFQVQRADLVVPVAGNETLRLPAQAFLEAGGFIEEADDFFVDTTFDAFLPKAVLRYQIRDNLSTFLSYQRAYRAGGAEILSDGTLNEFDPEFTDNFETGLRLSLFDDRLDARLNVFYIDWTDQQVRQLTEDQESFRTNAGSSHLSGAELELDWRASRSLRGYLSAGVVATEFDDFVFQGEDLSGNEFVRAPSFSGSLGGVWRPGGNFVAAVSLSHTEEYFLRVQNDPIGQSDAFTLLNARAGFETRRWSALMSFRNLLNEDYATARFRANQDVGGEGILVNYGDLRRVGLELDVFF